MLLKNIVQSLLITAMMFQLVFCNDDDDDSKLYLTPVSPVRLPGQELKLKVRTGDKFLDYYVDFDLKIEINDDAVSPEHSIRDGIVNYETVFTDLDKGGLINAKLTVDNELVSSNSTNLVVVKDVPIMVAEKNKEKKLVCLNPTKQNSNLRIGWLEDNVVKDKALSVYADEKAVSENYTCVIATADAVRHYGSIQNALNKSSAIAVVRRLVVVTIQRTCSGGDVCNITACLENMSRLPMNFTNMDGEVLKHGFSTISVLTNKSSSVQLVIYSNETVLFRKNITEESHYNESSALSDGAIVGIVLSVVVFFAVVVAIGLGIYKNKNGHFPWSNGSKGAAGNIKEMEKLDCSNTL